MEILEKNNRNYNSAFAFASFEANITPPSGRGPYCFRLQGRTYHHASNLHPFDNEQLKYGHPYIIDTNEANQTRAGAAENSNCLLPVFAIISNAMDNNPYTAAYWNMRTIEREEQDIEPH